MIIPDRPSEPKIGYVLDSESATEMACLMLQDRLLNQILGGLFPERDHIDGIHTILDIGCGPGGWALDVARSYPQTNVVGIDISDTMLTYARGQVEFHALKNIKFRKMDALQGLDFPDSSFDLVNIRAAIGYVPRDQWPQLLKECSRITRPEGILRLSEGDRAGLTNSAAFEKYFRFCSQLLYAINYGFSVDGFTMGMTPMMEQLLREAGYQNIQAKSYALDFSYGTTFYFVQLQNIEVSFKLIQPLLLKQGIATLEEIESTYAIMQKDLREETFCGIRISSHLSGRKA